MRHSTFSVWIIGILLLAVAANAQTGGPSRSQEAANSCADRGPVIRITVKTLRHGSGMVVADLHGDNPKTFLKKGKKLKRVRVPARSGSVSFCVPVAAPGTYALAVYHDENGNRKFDKNWLGIPSEPYGISNNPGFRLGAPPFEEAAFKVNGDGATLSITLRH